MRWFACVALCSTLGFSVAAVTPAMADGSGMAVGSASSASSDTPQWHKHRDNARRSGGMSCYAAATYLWQQGYRPTEVTGCYGSSYSFRATSNVTRYEVDVNSRTGKIIFIKPY